MSLCPLHILSFDDSSDLPAYSSLNHRRTEGLFKACWYCYNTGNITEFHGLQDIVECSGKGCWPPNLLFSEHPPLCPVNFSGSLHVLPKVTGWRISDDYEVSHSYVYYRWPDQTPTPPLVWVLANVFLWVLGSFLHTCLLSNLEMPHQDISLINLPLILVCKTFSLRCSPLLSPEDHFNSPFQGNLCIPCSVLIVTSGAVYCCLVIF